MNRVTAVNVSSLYVAKLGAVLLVFLALRWVYLFWFVGYRPQHALLVSIAAVIAVFLAVGLWRLMPIALVVAISLAVVGVVGSVYVAALSGAAPTPILAAVVGIVFVLACVRLLLDRRNALKQPG